MPLSTRCLKIAPPGYYLSIAHLLITLKILIKSQLFAIEYNSHYDILTDAFVKTSALSTSNRTATTSLIAFSTPALLVTLTAHDATNPR